MEVSLAPNGVNFVPAPSVAFHVYANPRLSHLCRAAGRSRAAPPSSSAAAASRRAHTNASLARCRVGRREAEPVLNVSAIDAAGVRCAPNSPTELYAIGVEKGVQVALNGQQFAPSPSRRARAAAAAAPSPRQRRPALPALRAPQLSAIWPTGGPAAGGSPVTLHGVGFDHGIDSTVEHGAPPAHAAAEGDGLPSASLAARATTPTASRAASGARCRRA